MSSDSPLRFVSDALVGQIVDVLLSSPGVVISDPLAFEQTCCLLVATIEAAMACRAAAHKGAPPPLSRGDRGRKEARAKGRDNAGTANTQGAPAGPPGS